MIYIENVTKSYSGRLVVNQLSLSVRPGEVFGLLGPNGAGKTTTIRMLTTLTKPDSGNIRIHDCTLADNDLGIRKIIGVVPQQFNLDVDLTAWENLELHGRLHHMPRDLRRARIDELLAYVELSDRCHERINGFSGGMKRRLMIARALLHSPTVLFLDEPTVGLDPQVRRRLWDLIRRMQGDGLTVFLTTHYIEEAENLCQRVAILNQGSLIALESPQTLCRQIGAYAVQWCDDLGDTQYRFFDSRQQAASFANDLQGEITIRNTNLEDVFVEMTGRRVRGDAV